MSWQCAIQVCDNTMPQFSQEWGPGKFTPRSEHVMPTGLQNWSHVLYSRGLSKIGDTLINYDLFGRVPRRVSKSITPWLRFVKLPLKQCLDIIRSATFSRNQTVYSHRLMPTVQVCGRGVTIWANFAATGPGHFEVKWWSWIPLYTEVS